VRRHHVTDAVLDGDLGRESGLLMRVQLIGPARSVA
jgi:hypothetical protein